jgi:asparagine synthase (glutamine-hydrolysing)
MCGINGFSWNDEALIKRMNSVTEHRGPDDSGFLTDKYVSLGHSRLSIIDLSEKGHQPMPNEDRSLWIIYNGEVYNFEEIRKDLLVHGHIFKSATDTEVILHAYEQYGLDCVKKFNGMWAFCIYDLKAGSLVLCRDQFGIKPLYYYHTKENLIFSSMIAGILCHTIETSPNSRIIMEYLAYNLQDHDVATFFSHVNHLPSGSFLIYNLITKECEIKKWYYERISDKEDKRDIKDHFIESVKLRTIADVPVGSCLSGGIDSSSIVCILDSLLGDKFYTFSLVVPGSVLDESRYIKEIGKHTKTKQFFTTIEYAEFLDELHDFIVAQEEPVTRMTSYSQYRVMKLAYHHGAKVLLDGQGGDEIFAGYIYYFSYYFYELLISGAWYSLIKESFSYTKNFRNFYPQQYLLFLLLPDRIKFFLWSTFMNTWVNHQYLYQVCGETKDPRWNIMNLRDSNILTLFTTAIPHLLNWEDKNSMRWSIEARLPFLDVNLVELALDLPASDKLKDGYTKVAFKDAMSDILPDMIRKRKDKIGFGTPVDDFFRNEDIVNYCSGIIYSESFKNRPYWNWSVIESRFKNHISKKVNAGEEIWKWINLELWLREYFPLIA